MPFVPWAGSEIPSSPTLGIEFQPQPPVPRTRNFVNLKLGVYQKNQSGGPAVTPKLGAGGAVQVGVKEFRDGPMDTFRRSAVSRPDRILLPYNFVYPQLISFSLGTS
jgi:hypothetical protein